MKFLKIIFISLIIITALTINTNAEIEEYMKKELIYKNYDDFNRSDNSRYTIIHHDLGMTGPFFTIRIMYNGIREIEGQVQLEGEELFRALTYRRKSSNGDYEYVLRKNLFVGKEHYLKSADGVDYISRPNKTPHNNVLIPPEVAKYFKDEYGIKLKHGLTGDHIINYFYTPPDIFLPEEIKN